MKNIFIIIIVSTILLSCEKKSCTTPPNELLFKLSINNSEIAGSYVDSIKIFYYKAGSKNYINDLYWYKELNGTNISNKNIIFSNTLSNLSGYEKINDFYFEYSNQTIDTLVCKQNLIITENCSSYELSKLSYNGKQLVLDTSIEGLKVYRIEK